MQKRSNQQQQVSKPQLTHCFQNNLCIHGHMLQGRRQLRYRLVILEKQQDLKNNISSGLCYPPPPLRDHSKALPCMSTLHHHSSKTERREYLGILLSTLFNYVTSLSGIKTLNLIRINGKKNRASEKQQPLYHFSGQLSQPLPPLKRHIEVDSDFTSCTIHILFVCSLLLLGLSCSVLFTCGNCCGYSCQCGRVLLTIHLSMTGSLRCSFLCCGCVLWSCTMSV